ncbi:MAG TPA: SPOR domain-containing protein [Burkholderiales bacterium]
MRVAFLVLLLANLALYTWLRYGVSEVEPVPLSRQIAPEKLKVVAPAGLPPVSAVTKPPAPAPAPAAAPASPASSVACVEWGSFTLADAARAEQALEPLALGPRLAQRRTEEQAGWWVFIPPQGTRQSALRKAAELKQLGVEEYFIVQEEGPLRWALSLGVFRTEESAQARLAALRGQGVRTARVGARDTTVPKVWLQVKGVDAPLQARLKEIAGQVEGSELKDCP